MTIVVMFVLSAELFYIRRPSSAILALAGAVFMVRSGLHWFGDHRWHAGRLHEWAQNGWIVGASCAFVMFSSIYAAFALWEEHRKTI